jgi:hypothetical protein
MLRSRETSKQLKRTKYVIVNINKMAKNTIFWDGRCVVRYKFSDVSEERAASSFRLEEYARQGNRASRAELGLEIVL